MQGGSAQSEVWPCGMLVTWCLPFLRTVAEFLCSRLMRAKELCLVNLSKQCRIKLPNTPGGRHGERGWADGWLIGLLVGSFGEQEASCPTVWWFGCWIT